MAPYPDVAPFAGSSFDCCDLLQRNVIYHGTGKASGISSWCASSIVRLQTIGLKRWSSAFGALGPIRRRENDQKFAYEKIICARRRPNRSVLMADGATLTFVAGRTARSGVARAGCRALCKWSILYKLWSADGCTLSVTEPLSQGGWLSQTYKNGTHPVVRCTRNEARQEQGRQVRRRSA